MTEELLVKALLEARPRLLAVAVLVVRDPHTAADLFQEVMVKALRMPDSFDEASGLLAWARVVIRNAAVDHVRRAGRLGEILSEMALDAVESRMEERAELQRQRMKALATCLGKLPDESRTLLRLRYDEGRRGAEVARLLRRSEAAIFKALSRLHLSLRQCVTDQLSTTEIP